MLRDYQTDICDRVIEAFTRYQSVMAQMPTGTGKTVVLASIVREMLGANGKGTACASVLIVAHRRELIVQIKGTIKRLEMASEMVAVESVQTISRRISEGTCLLNPALIVIDEAHHALATTYRALWKKWPKAKFLGLTATPCRMSGDGFGDLFDVLLVSWSVKRFMAEGWLAAYDYFSIKPDCEDQKMIDSIVKRGADGDYQMKELREKMDARPSIQRLFDTFERFAANKKGIVYAIDIPHAEHIAAYYQDMGVHAVAVSSKTPKGVRDEIIAKFRMSGNFNSTISGNSESTVSEEYKSTENDAENCQVLVSVDLFSEGFDCPDVEFIQLARPTLSLSKYLQMVGRGLRPCAGKECCIILDNVGLYRTFGLPSAERDWQATFLGAMDAEAKSSLAAQSEMNRGILPPYLLEQSDEDIVKIVSHQQQELLAADKHAAGFEKVIGRKGAKWLDHTNDIEYMHQPWGLDFGDVELATDDGLTFYPRILSPWIDKKHGINKKVLETQIGCGISWQKRFISLMAPNKVLMLEKVYENEVRVYRDERGLVYVQLNPDAALQSVEDAGGMDAVIERSQADYRRWMEVREALHQRKEKYSYLPPEGWHFPPNAERTMADGIAHVRYEQNGEMREYWLDTKTGFRHELMPIVYERGFVELLREGDWVFVRNIKGLEGWPFYNWAIRADQNICTIGDNLYFKNDKRHTFHIKKRSEDFRMFVLEADFLVSLYDEIPYNLLVINNPGKEPEFKNVRI